MTTGRPSTSVTEKDKDKKEVMDELVRLGVIGQENAEKEFGDFLARRQAALDYVSTAEASTYVKAAAQGQDSYLTDHAVYSYYDDKEYQDPSKSYAKYSTSLFQTSIEGGKKITDEYGKKAASVNPLGLETCPQGNITVALKQTFCSSGGYYGHPEKKNDPPQTAAIMHAYAYEFEKLDAKKIQANVCPFIKVDSAQIRFTPGSRYKALEVGIVKQTITRKGEMVKETILGKFKGNKDVKLVKQLFLDTEGYIKKIKEDALKQMHSIVHALKQAGDFDPKKPLQLNLTLPGLGFFACLDGNTNLSIADTLARYAAEGVKQAISEFATEQKKHPDEPQITDIRLSYPPDPPPANGKAQRQAIEKVFAITQDDKAVVKDIGGIKVSRTLRTVESLDKGVAQVVCVNGDPRAYPGNESTRASQEPGIYSNVLNGRKNLSALIHPFSALAPGRLFRVSESKNPGGAIEYDHKRIEHLEHGLHAYQQKFAADNEIIKNMEQNIKVAKDILTKLDALPAEIDSLAKDLADLKKVDYFARDPDFYKRLAELDSKVQKESDILRSKEIDFEYEKIMKGGVDRSVYEEKYSAADKAGILSDAQRNHNKRLIEITDIIKHIQADLPKELADIIIAAIVKKQADKSVMLPTLDQISNFVGNIQFQLSTDSSVMHRPDMTLAKIIEITLGKDSILSSLQAPGPQNPHQNILEDLYQKAVIAKQDVPSPLAPPPPPSDQAPVVDPTAVTKKRSTPVLLGELKALTGKFPNIDHQQMYGIAKELTSKWTIPNSFWNKLNSYVVAFEAKAPSDQLKGLAQDIFIQLTQKPTKSIDVVMNTLKMEISQRKIDFKEVQAVVDEILSPGRSDELARYASKNGVDLFWIATINKELSATPIRTEQIQEAIQKLRSVLATKNSTAMMYGILAEAFPYINLRPPLPHSSVQQDSKSLASHDGKKGPTFPSPPPPLTQAKQQEPLPPQAKEKDLPPSPDREVVSKEEENVSTRPRRG